ncbi:hypothetical protein QMK19_11925 [Streptomyces sp. H10-C2]|uniref:hypothetical protein n=1 Tax=unclassified Streptomyces TaxID=2593676 RepID=UPI0024BBBF7D|nr:MULTISPECIES: hypothetical protein [unclassified Streptomyces]MDJ0341880.1 hypothetical protein [Streptomyces sp. PH10-H1]MDJ0370366.1 hypothetical protein [Streptomyces sp. H10-C2]
MAGEVAMPYDSAGQGGEEQFDLVEPGGMRRGPADVPTRMGGQPRLGVPGGVGGAVVEYDVDLPARNDRPVELVQEGGECRRVVAGDHLGEDLAGAHVESGDEGGGAVAPVLELLPGGSTRAYRTAGIAT